MCKDHVRNPHLNVPDWLKKEWASARKDDIADVLRQCNFDKDEFLATMKTIVTKRQTTKLKKEQGWYCEEEMRSDLKWKESKILGAKTRCLELPETHVRNNAYDGVQEFWVTIRESGTKTEETSYEESHQKTTKATTDPVFNMPGEKFKGLAGMEKRDESESKQAAAEPHTSRYGQAWNHNYICFISNSFPHKFGNFKMNEVKVKFTMMFLVIDHHHFTDSAGPVITDAANPGYLGAQVGSNNTGEFSAWIESAISLLSSEAHLPSSITFVYTSKLEVG